MYIVISRTGSRNNHDVDIEVICIQDDEIMRYLVYELNEYGHNFDDTLETVISDGNLSNIINLVDNYSCQRQLDDYYGIMKIIHVPNGTDANTVVNHRIGF